jgi:hypothetical protein
MPQRRKISERRQRLAAVAAATLFGACGDAGVGVLSTLRYASD